MLEAIKRWFESRQRDLAGPDSPEQRERSLRLATAALVFEVVRADGRVRERELAVMRAAIRSAFDVSEAELDELMTLAEEASREAVSLYEFTQLVDQGFSADQKKRIVELLWLATFADAEKHALEEQLVRRIAGLLHVSHPDFIDAKLRARGARRTPH